MELIELRRIPNVVATFGEASINNSIAIYTNDSSKGNVLYSALLTLEKHLSGDASAFARIDRITIVTLALFCINADHQPELTAKILAAMAEQIERELK